MLLCHLTSNVLERISTYKSVDSSHRKDSADEVATHSCFDKVLELNLNSSAVHFFNSKRRLSTLRMNLNEQG